MAVLTSREDERLSVPEFYAGKSIFVTGGTGFLGKVFIEKLLYSCPDIDKIYMLIREKKNLSIGERMSKFLDDPLFSRLKEERPGDLEKIVLIPGDITAPNLGLSAENERILIEKVSVIINSAATVKFNEPLPIAWKINVEGTRMLLALSRKMKRIEVFIHISTAYSNASSERTVVDEILYPAPADMDQVYQLVKDGVTEEETERLLNGLPNTYTFTKALTEHLVAEHQTYVPTIIVRPSVVASIKDEPIRGWLCNWFGATGISVFTAKGLNRVLFGKASNIVDVIPVDYVANLVIVAGAKSGGQKSDELKIYNCCSSDCNPVTLKKIIKEFIDDTIKNKSLNYNTITVFGYLLPNYYQECITQETRFTRVYCEMSMFLNGQPDIMLLPGWYVFTKYKWLMTLLIIIFQMLPMYLADVYRVLMGKIPRYMKLHHLVIKTRLGIDFFTSHSWVMKTDRVRELFGSLSPAEKHMFPCDPSSIDWTDYLQSYCCGVRRFLEKRK